MLNPLDQIISKDTKQDWPHYWPLEGTTGDQSPAGFNSMIARPSTPYDAFSQVSLGVLQKKKLLDDAAVLSFLL